jgi:hypothetical protein
LIEWGTPTVYENPGSSYMLELGEDFLTFVGTSERAFPAESGVPNPMVQFGLPFTVLDWATATFVWESEFIAGKTVADGVLLSGSQIVFDTRPPGGWGFHRRRKHLSW